MATAPDVLLQEVKERLRTLYGDRLARVVLYGSQARGEATAESDVDVLVVLRGAFDLYAETKRLVRLSMELLDRYGEDVSFQPFTEASFLDPASSFMRSVHRSGIPS